MPTVDDNATALSGAQFPAVQANTLAALIGSAPQGATSSGEEILASEWDNGAITVGASPNNSTIRQANLVAVQAWLDYCAANSKVAVLDGRVNIEGTIDMRDKVFALRGIAQYDGGGSAGSGSASQFRSYSTNVPMFRCAETTPNTVFTKFHIDKINFSFSANQTGTSGNCIQMGQTYFYSTIRNSTMNGCYTGILNTGGNIFSNLFDAITVTGIRGWGLQSLSGGTGNIFNGLHILGNTASPPTCRGGLHIKFFNSNNVINQLNVEWMKVDNAGILMETCRGNVINGINCERIEPVSNVGIIRAIGGCLGNLMTGVKFQHPVFSSANGTTAGAFFRSNGANSLVVIGLHIQETEVSGSTVSLVGAKETSGTQTSTDEYYFKGVHLNNGDSPGLTAFDSYTQSEFRVGVGVIKEFNNIMQVGSGGYREASGSQDSDADLYISDGNVTNYNSIYFTAPITAARTRTLKNTFASAVAATLPVGARYTIVRSPTSGGNFPLNINNDEDTTMVQLIPGSGANFHFTSGYTWVLDEYWTLPQPPIQSISHDDLALSTTAPSVVVA